MYTCYSIMGDLFNSVSLALLSVMISSTLISGAYSATFTISNKCSYTVWPGILSGAGTAALSTTGFSLQQGETKTVDAPSSWSGRIWGRTLCSQGSSGNFSCVTGDCSSGSVACKGNNAVPPATLAEFTLDGAGGLDFYDVSLVDGYNLPMLVVPRGGSGGGNCSSTGCAYDLNSECPVDLRVSGDGGNSVVACKSACEAFGDPQYCCSGAFGNPNTCQPSSFSRVFKTACPTAYSYAYDDKTSTFTCASADYDVTFCPTPNTSQKASSSQQNGAARGSEPGPSLDNHAPTLYGEGELEVSGVTRHTCGHVAAIAVSVGISTALSRLRHHG